MNPATAVKPPEGQSASKQEAARRDFSSLESLMAQWTAFDLETSLRLREFMPHETVVSLPRGHAVEYAAQAGRTVVALLPALTQSEALVAVFRTPVPAVVLPSQPETQAPDSRVPGVRGFRAGGFLGLSDEAVFEDEEVPQKKSWWQRFWD